MRSLMLLPVVAVVLAACGGGGRRTASCSVYDRNGAAYVTVRAPGTAEQATRACTALARRWSSSSGLFWSRFRGPASYAHDVRICAMRHGGGEVDVYDLHPTSHAGTTICSNLAAKGWQQVG
jgi:hypothetical protein